MNETTATRATTDGEISRRTLAAFDREELYDVLKTMKTARAADERGMNLIRQGKSFFHIAGAGHEAIQAATARRLNPQVDWLYPYYRDLALVIGAGVSLEDIFLQIFAKADDPSGGGRQLPSHWGATHINLPAQSSNTGTQFLHAVGSAMALKRKGIEGVAYVSSGEGTTSQGEYHEALNWASREKLPVLFVVQNNKYAISVPSDDQISGREGRVCEMAAGYHNLKREFVDGADYVESARAVEEALAYIKAGEGPALIEADVVRLHSHSSSDDQKKYRDGKELEDDLRRCPIANFERRALEEGIFSESELTELDDLVKRELAVAVERAERADDPDPATAADHVYDQSGKADGFEYEKSEPRGHAVVMVDAINHALREEMERNEDVYIFGEDVAGAKGGVFTVTKGLTDRFGADRVFNSPLAEASIIGVATGMAMSGLRPAVEIQFGDYIWPAFMQLRNELATIRYRSNNARSAPVAIRVPVGGKIHGGLYHSQNIEGFFAHVPGVYVVYPSNAADAKGLLKTALRMDDPVLFLEHKGLYRQGFAKAPEPDADYLLPLGKARVVKGGSDLTVVSYGLTLWDALNAARRLEKEGRSVEVVDIRTINPLDKETIYQSVRKTGKALVAHEDTLTAGFGAEIAALIAEFCFERLDGPVRRVGAMDAHIPYNPKLENAVIPDKDDLYRAMTAALDY
jgi:2-oxoisovalerate dehydrogenase E1 component